MPDLRKSLILVTLPALLIGGCSHRTAHQDAGIVVGGLAGAAVGSSLGHGRHGRHLGLIFGTIAGAMVGSAVGRHMDEHDRMRAGDALEYTPTHQPAHWRNPDRGYEYDMTPTRTYETREGPCRDFTMDARMENGRRERIYGTACRDRDGYWRMVNDR